MGWISVQTAWLEKRTLAKAARVFPQRRLIPCASGRPARRSPRLCGAVLHVGLRTSATLLRAAGSFSAM